MLDLKKVPLQIAREFERRCGDGIVYSSSRGKPPAEVTRVFKEAPLRTIDPAHENYSTDGPFGLKDARKLFAQVLRSPWEQTVLFDNQSLLLMGWLVSNFLSRPLPNMDGTWQHMHWSVPGKPPRPKMLYIEPGYDRYKHICAAYGIDIEAVPMKDGRLDIERIRSLARSHQVVGMWCVPIYANWTGYTLTHDECEALASMEAFNPKFKIIWDLAYIEHHLVDDGDTIPDIVELCEKHGNPDRAIKLGSVSKISMPGAGLSFMASSEANMNWVKAALKASCIGGGNAQNQQKHVDFFRDIEGIRRHMRKVHRPALSRRFDTAYDVLEDVLSKHDFVSWNYARGGYFICVFVGDLADRVRKLCEAMKLSIVSEGQYFRLAPTFESVTDVASATEVFCLAVLIAAHEAGKL